MPVHPRDSRLERRRRASLGDGGVARLVLISGGGQTGEVSTTLPDPIVVQAQDAAGDPVNGVSVSASPSGDGSVDASPKVTAGSGTVSFDWTLGSTPGAQLLTFTAGGYESTLAPATATPAETLVRVRSAFHLLTQQRLAA